MKDSDLNINDMMKILSTMDPEKLKQGLSQASKILNSPDADKIINEIKNKRGV